MVTIRKETLIGKLSFSLAIIAVLFFVSLCAFPVYERWSIADLFLIEAVSALFVILSFLSLFKTKDAKLTLVDVLLALWLVYYILRLWLSPIYPQRTDALKTIAVAALYASLRWLFSFVKQRSVLFDLLVVSFILLGVYESCYGFLQLIIDASRHDDFPITGSFLNPGPYSAILLFQSVMCMIWNPSIKALRYARWLLLLFSLILLPITTSRGAIISLVLVAFWLYRKQYWQWRWLLWILAVLGVVALIFLKIGSVEGRLLIWRSALCSWSNVPLFGVGIGGFPKAYSDGLYVLSSSMTDLSQFRSANVASCAFNDLLGILVEQGIVGCVFALLLVVLALKHLVKLSKIFFFGIASLCSFSIFSYPSSQLPFQIICLLILAFSESDPDVPFGLCVKSKWLTISFLACAPLLFQIGRVVCDELTIQQEYASITHTDKEEYLLEYYYLYETEYDDPEFLFQFAHLLREQGRYSDSNAMLTEGALLSSDPMFYVLMGNNFCDLKRFEEAEEAYLSAFYRMPNRIYPLYQLMKLYEIQEDREKASKMARRVLEMREKVSSPAVDEMKREAMAYVERFDTNK